MLSLQKLIYNWCPECLLQFVIILQVIGNNLILKFTFNENNISRILMSMEEDVKVAEGINMSILSLILHMSLW